jgi:hypothetical protein
MDVPSHYDADTYVTRLAPGVLITDVRINATINIRIHVLPFVCLRRAIKGSLN